MGKVLLVPVSELYRIGADGVAATMGLYHGTAKSGTEGLAGDSRESAAEQLSSVECLWPGSDRPGFYQGDVAFQDGKVHLCRSHALLVMCTEGNRGVSMVGGECVGSRTIERETQRRQHTHPRDIGLPDGEPRYAIEYPIQGRRGTLGIERQPDIAIVVTEYG